MVYGIRDLLEKAKEVKGNITAITAEPLSEYIQKNQEDIGIEPNPEISNAAGASNYGRVHVSRDVSIEEGARVQGEKILVSKDALNCVYGKLKRLAIQERTMDIAQKNYYALRERVESSKAFKNIDGATNNMLSQGKTNMQQNYTETKKDLEKKRAELTSNKGRLLDSIKYAATDLELQQFDKKHTGTTAQKRSVNAQKSMFILFIGLGISSIAALQYIESANSFNATGYFLTSASLVSTNVIFVLFVFITGFLLGKHQK